VARTGRLRVAVAGLRFGAAFVPIYCHHPDVECAGIVDPDSDRLTQVGDMFDVTRRHTDLADALEADYDAIHLVTPIPQHADQTVAVLEANKHCACTVPMATSLDDIQAIIDAQRRTGRNYMMMETAVYTRQFLYARHLVASGRLGRIQFVRGAHYQDMEHWPDYWMGLPPMWYATHAVSPCLAITETRATSVHCFGSGAMRDELQARYHNSHPIETAIFQLDRPGLAMEITRSLFHTGRGYTESFNVYGEKMTFEWPQIEHEDDPVVFTVVESDRDADTLGRGRHIDCRRVVAPDRQDLLPPEIARFTVRGRYDDTNPQKAFEAGGGHHGSHPHLVHEFVRSIVEGRKPWIDEVRAGDWTAAGICAHQSAMLNGRRATIPDFRT